MSPKFRLYYKVIGSWGYYARQLTHPLTDAVTKCAVRKWVVTGAESPGHDLKGIFFSLDAPSPCFLASVM